MTETKKSEDFRISSLHDNTEIIIGERLKSVNKILRSALKVLSRTDGLFYRLVKVDAATYFKKSENIVLNISAILVDSNKVIKDCFITLLFEGSLDRGFEIVLEFEGELKVVKTCKNYNVEIVENGDRTRRKCCNQCQFM